MTQVLIVEHDDMSREVLERRLRRRGYEVTSASEGLGAIDLAARLLPDLILMELVMPEVDGLEATRVLKSNLVTAHIPVVGLARDASGEARQQALAAGCEEFLALPVGSEDLLRCLEGLLAPGEAQAEAPRVTIASPLPLKPQPPQALGVDSGHILVVDDNGMNRDILARRLRRLGYHVDTACDGFEAMQRIAAGGIELILLDVMMPGVSGLEVLVKLRQTWSPAELPVIMATARDQSEDIVQALELGANDYVTKPIDFPVVAARVKTQLALRDMAVALQAREASYRALAERSSDMISRADGRGRFLYVSPASEAPLGYRPEELVGTDGHDLVHPNDLVELLDAYAAARDNLTAIYRMRRVDGSYLWVEANKSLFRDPHSGKITEMQCALRDISEPLERMDPNEPPLPGATDLVSHPGWRRGVGATGTSGEVAALSARSGGQGILMVLSEDPTGRYLVEHGFTRSGWSVVGARSLAQALELAAELPPDVVLLDADCDVLQDELVEALDRLLPEARPAVLTWTIYGYLNGREMLGPFGLRDLVEALRSEVDEITGRQA